MVAYINYSLVILLLYGYQSIVIYLLSQSLASLYD